jgi:hypothetical protein
MEHPYISEGILVSAYYRSSILRKEEEEEDIQCIHAGRVLVINNPLPAATA